MTRTEVLSLVNKNGYTLATVREVFRNDKDIVLTAVHNTGMSLQYASKRLRNDKDVVTTAVGATSDAFEYASDSLKNDADFVMLITLIRRDAFKYASFELQNNKEFILAFVQRNGLDLCYVTDHFKHDLEVLVEAMYEDRNARLSVPGAFDQHPVIKYLYYNNYKIELVDWPLIRKALLEKHEYFLNPEPYMQVLTADMEYPYVLLAEYALNKDVMIEPENYPELNVNV